MLCSRLVVGDFPWFYRRVKSEVLGVVLGYTVYFTSLVRVIRFIRVVRVVRVIRVKMVHGIIRG